MKRPWSMAGALGAARRYSWGLRGLCHTPATGWRSKALCLGLPTAMFMGNHAPRARALCASCPVRLDCLAVALSEERGRDRDLIYGVRGGLSPTDRHAVLMEATR